MQNYFAKYRNGIIGINTKIPKPEGGEHTIVYSDWTASGRCFAPIEERLQHEIMPLVANTHTETSTTGMAMTYAYHQARTIIKKHVNATNNDIIITSGSGMTGVVNKFQRILGFRQSTLLNDSIKEEDRPVVFISHMEHHSNQTSWLETIATVEIIEPNEEGLICLTHLSGLIQKYAHRKIKIASITACSNVTGIQTPYHEIAKIMHEAKGLIFVDFACSAPYVNINMHPENQEEKLDAIFFSPHKFLGGPGTTGVLIFDKKLYKNDVPDDSGGGTVDWTNPWGQHKYIDDIEAREDGGTPPFLQTIKTAMCVSLKEQMGVKNILEREHEVLTILWNKIEHIPNLHILAPKHKNRLAIMSFYIEDMHYNLGVRILSDKFGIQARGGCSCAGTYGHYLLNVDQSQSQKITDLINLGDFSNKPGWIRVSLHPTMTNEEVEFIGNSIQELAKNFNEWGTGYDFIPCQNSLTLTDRSADEKIKHAMDEALTKSFV
jgi:selenocysteine lyase/cysteine desulfurase